MPGFEMYDRVEANYMGSGKWYSGIIVGVYFGAGTSSYDVAYDDGDRRTGVAFKVVAGLQFQRLHPDAVDDAVIAGVWNAPDGGLSRRREMEVIFRNPKDFIRSSSQALQMCSF